MYGWAKTAVPSIQETSRRSHMISSSSGVNRNPAIVWSKCSIDRLVENDTKMAIEISKRYLNEIRNHFLKILSVLFLTSQYPISVLQNTWIRATAQHTSVKLQLLTRKCCLQINYLLWHRAATSNLKLHAKQERSSVQKLASQNFSGVGDDVMQTTASLFIWQSYVAIPLWLLCGTWVTAECVHWRNICLLCQWSREAENNRRFHKVFQMRVTSLSLNRKVFVRKQFNFRFSKIVFPKMAESAKLVKNSINAKWP